MFIITFMSGMTKKLSNERAVAIMELKQKGEKDIAIEGFGLVSANSISSIIDYNEWRKAQVNSLSTRGKILCKYDCVHDERNGCDCVVTACEKGIDASHLLAAGEQPSVNPETLKKARELLKKLNEQTSVEKPKEGEWSHENFIRSHPNLHETSEAIKRAYEMTKMI